VRDTQLGGIGYWLSGIGFKVFHVLFYISSLIEI
jgi:hypothetical protein